jgi:hypothetical protein
MLKLREDRPATIEEHRALRDEIERLRSALRELRTELPSVGSGNTWVDQCVRECRIIIDSALA